MKIPFYQRRSLMINLEVKTSLAIDETNKRLKAFFGQGGLGLEVTEDSSDCLNFQGSGGFVNAVLCQDEGKTRIELTSQEWERQVEKFAGGLPK